MLFTEDTFRDLILAAIYIKGPHQDIRKTILETAAAIIEADPHSVRKRSHADS